MHRHRAKLLEPVQVQPVLLRRGRSQLRCVQRDLRDLRCDWVPEVPGLDEVDPVVPVCLKPVPDLRHLVRKLHDQVPDLH